MYKTHRAPISVAEVASVALGRGRNVIRTLLLRILGKITSAVAVGAYSRCAGVVHGRRLECDEVCVARIAGSGCRNVPGIFGLRVGKNKTSAMAVRAQPGRSAVVHLGGLERDEISVAGVAESGRRHMTRRLAYGGNPMAGPATVGRSRIHRNMRIGGRCPGQGDHRIDVAGVALRRGWLVRGGFDLSVLGKVGPGVARNALSVKPGMVHPGRDEGSEIVVATVALASGRDMRSGLGLRIDYGVTAAVAGRALPREAGVVHRCRLECHKIGVAGTALAGRRNMTGGLRKRNHRKGRWRAVVARIAYGIGGKGMHIGRGGPGGRAGVARVALRACHKMVRGLGLGILRQIGPAVARRTLSRQAGMIHRA